MRKMVCIILALFILVLSGCSIGKLDMVYSPGEYTMNEVDCTGYLTNGLLDLHVVIPLGKRILDRQTVIVDEINGAALRTVNGTCVGGLRADLSDYILSAFTNNDGAVLHVVLRNDEKWQDGAMSNTPITGYVNIRFSISGS